MESIQEAPLLNLIMLYCPKSLLEKEWMTLRFNFEESDAVISYKSFLAKTITQQF